MSDDYDDYDFDRLVEEARKTMPEPAGNSWYSKRYTKPVHTGWMPPVADVKRTIARRKEQERKSQEQADARDRAKIARMNRDAAREELEIMRDIERQHIEYGESSSSIGPTIIAFVALIVMVVVVFGGGMWLVSH